MARTTACVVMETLVDDCRIRCASLFDLIDKLHKLLLAKKLATDQWRCDEPYFCAFIVPVKGETASTFVTGPSSRLNANAIAPSTDFERPSP